MNPSILLTACATLAVASSLVACSKPADYLDLNTETSGLRDLRLNLGLTKVIFEEVCEKGDNADLMLDKMKFRAGKIGNEHMDSPLIKNIYTQLIDVASKDTPCSLEQSEVLLQFFRQKCEPGLKHWMLGKFAEYLKEFGRPKFANCVAKLAAEYQTEPLSGPEEQMDQFFAAGLKLDSKQDLSDADLLPGLQKLDLTSGKFDVRKASDAAKKMGFDNRNHWHVDYRRFSRFMDSGCYSLQSQHRNALYTIALARLFDPQAKVNSTRLLKLHEYNRLCLSWQRGDKRAAVEVTLEYQLNLHPSFAKLTAEPITNCNMLSSDFSGLRIANQRVILAP